MFCLVEPGHSYGSLEGVSIGTVSESKKVWLVFQALGDVAFAYAFSMILIEIQVCIEMLNIVGNAHIHMMLLSVKSHVKISFRK